MQAKASLDATEECVAINNDTNDKANLNRNKLHYAWSPLFIGLWLLLCYLATLSFHTLPHAIQIKETEGGNKFIAERALNDLLDLTNIGPRVVGSPQNEKAAIQFFIKKIDAIRKQMNNDIWHMEEDIQVVSGTNVISNSVNIYQGIQNYVVKLSPKQSNSNSSLLINSHFDSVPGSPGAGDDGTMVAVMLEVLRILAQSSEPLQHSIVFLFNGAEENSLLGSHGFIMHHKWASSVKAYINLDSAGNGGREILFQSAARRGLWLMKYYIDNAVHPYANTVYEELFQNGFIPSQTDFKIFRDSGYLPGLDLAQAYNGYVYHTKFDRFEITPPGTIQNTGDNLLAIAKGLANASELQNPMDQKEGHAIFFDFINLFMVFYSEDVGLIINIVTVVITLVLIVASLWCMSKNSGVSKRGVLCHFNKTFLLQIVSIILAGGFLFAIAFILDLCKLTLSWFSQPWLILGLYFCPFYFVLSIIPAVYLHTTRKDALSFNYRVQLFLHSQGIVLVFILLGLISVNIRSAYIFMIALLFYDISLLVNLVSTMHNKQFKWIIFHLISQLLPVIFFSSLSYTFYTSLVPMQGRNDSNNNPEILIAGASIISASLIGGFLIPLICIFRKSVVIACSFLVVAFIFIIIIISPIGFPYTAETAPQRIDVFHTKRIFHDVDQSIKYTDSGYFLLPSDRNIWTITDYILKGSQIPKRKDYCKDYFNCGMPTFYSPRNIEFWKPSGEPNLDKSFKLKLVSKEEWRDNILRFTFNLKGPDVMKMLISPMKGVKLRNWSFETELEKLRSPYYFVTFCSGTDNSSFTFTLDFETPTAWNQSVFNLAIASHFMHHNDLYTSEFKEFLKSFPAWVYPSAWFTSTEQWIF